MYIKVNSLKLILMKKLGGRVKEKLNFHTLTNT